MRLKIRFKRNIPLYAAAFLVVTSVTGFGAVRFLQTDKHENHFPSDQEEQTSKSFLHEQSGPNVKQLDEATDDGSRSRLSDTAAVSPFVPLTHLSVGVAVPVAQGFEVPQTFLTLLQTEIEIALSNQPQFIVQPLKSGGGTKMLVKELQHEEMMREMVGAESDQDNEIGTASSPPRYLVQPLVTSYKSPATKRSCFPHAPDICSSEKVAGSLGVKVPFMDTVSTSTKQIFHLTVKGGSAPELATEAGRQLESKVKSSVTKAEISGGTYP